MNDYHNGDNLGLGQPEPAAPAATPEPVEAGHDLPDVWLSWSDADGYGYWPSQNEAGLYSAHDFEPVRYRPSALDQQAVRDELYAALVKLSNAYAFLKPPGYPKSDAEKQADSAILHALKSTNGGAACGQD